MKVTYLYHSGFLVELDNCYLIFDYYRGELPPLDSEKPVVVFASHFHQDHYNPEIFSKLKREEMKAFAVLAKDINKRRYPDDVEILKAYSRNEYDLPYGLKTKTLLSTDSGVAFIVYTDEGTIYHAGDLNDWYWEGEGDDFNRQMTSRYRAEIGTIKGESFKLAFVPLDPRQENHSFDGMLYFLKNTNCETVCPMHYWEQPGIISKFTNAHPEYKSIIKDSETMKGKMI